MSRRSLLAECIREAPGLAWDTDAEGRPMTREVVAGVAMTVRPTLERRARKGEPAAWSVEAVEAPLWLPEGAVWAHVGHGETLEAAIGAACAGVVDKVSRRREMEVTT